MQNVNKNTSKVISVIINTARPVEVIEKHLRKILENTKVDEWTNYKKIVTKENNRWDEPTYDCIFVDEREDFKKNIYHFGCFACGHSDRYLIRKTFKTLKGMINYLPKFIA